jgi:hypothetical protein
MHLGRQHHVISSSARQGLADDDLRLALRVDVGGVDEIDPGVERSVDDPDALLVILGAQSPNIIAPRHSLLTETPVRPSVRRSMGCSCPNAGARADASASILSPRTA